MKMQKAAKLKNNGITANAVINFPIVGIGASAGGLAAFEAFFSGMPLELDPDMAFVLVQHLSPDHSSALVDIIQRYTRMKVVEVQDGMSVEPNCTYIIPPGYDMAFLHGKLQLIEPTSPRGQRLTIDFFLRSLAQDQHGRAVGIILSGSGSDGSEGIKDIKAEGGMVIVQSPNSAEYDSMPRSAIETGVVDYILEPEAMAKQLIIACAQGIKTSTNDDPLLMSSDQNALNSIFILLRAQSGHDFSQYKLNTIHRRIERRINMNQLKNLNEYVKFLRQSSAEATALFQDLLIGVTNFFRDADAFAYLKDEILPKLFANKQAADVIRLWSVGCSSGEEAYSLAILLKEYMEDTKQNMNVQIFATDIDARAIIIARAGIYPESISANVSAERLERFFIAESNGHYRVHKNIRDMLIFSEQNVIKDPPFSKLDLISCRNLLIYMNAELQQKLIPLFHYALNRDAILFLGSSESIGDFGDLFNALSTTLKVFQRKEDVIGIQSRMLNRMPKTIVDTMINITPQKIIRHNEGARKQSLRTLMEQSLLQYTPLSGALVNEQGDILYLHGQMGRYLELPSGEMGVNNILKMAHDGLYRELTMALHKATLSKEAVHYPHLQISNHGIAMTVTLDVRYLSSNANATETDLYLITIEVLPNDLARILANETIPSKEVDARIAALKQELHEQEAFLQLANRKFEASNESLKSFNEEMQSLNEELQSTNEELETSKEELQSVNEELSTVNAELQTNVTDLSHTNNDMNNLLAGSNIGTVFVNHELCIMRFTPAITRILNLIPSDIGRPVSHIVSNLIDCADFTKHIQTVLDTLIPKEIEIQTNEGKWYLMRIQPYRTLENVIEGAVISFVDISELLEMRSALQKAKEQARLAVVLRDAFDVITVQDMNGKILAWNPAAVRLYGWTEAEALQMNVRDRIAPTNQAEALVKIASILEPYHTQRLTKAGELIDVWITATALLNEQGKVYAIATTERAVRSQQD